jgi:uncharacterized protein (TIGR02246 family)
MKRLLFAAAMLIAAPTFAVAQTTPATPSQPAAGQGAGDVKQALIDLEKGAWEAWKKKDGKYFESFLSDDTVQVSPAGVTRKAQIVKGIVASTCDVKGYEMDGFDVVMLNPDTALLTFSATQDATCGGAAEPSPVWASTVFVRRGGKWLAAFHQETPAQRPASQQTMEKKP